MPTKNLQVLVLGGAGYIGSQMVLSLKAAGYSVIVLDNLSKGHAANVLVDDFIIGNIGDTILLDNLFKQYTIQVVMHFAGFIDVTESIQKPLLYYQNNVVNTINLLDCLLRHRIQYLIFSSSAAVYGPPYNKLLKEQHPLHPMNPYGYTKYIIEQIIADAAKQSHLHYACLRYFNAAGADPQMRLGECHQPETHLIPLILDVVQGKQEYITLFGKQHATPDGTCIRDYIHVQDICDAHLKVLEALRAGKNHLIYNIGTGIGHSVLQVIQTARQITKHEIPITLAPARHGEPNQLIADTSLIKQSLNWEPRYSDLETIIQHAYAFVAKE
jgi:UDP-glucose 4-epimerase